MHDHPEHDHPEQAELELGRLGRLRSAIEDNGCDAALLYDPINIRYATGVSNMQVYSLHNPCRYALVPVEGPVVLFEFKGCDHLADDHPAVDEVRPATSWYDFITGPRSAEFATRWADEVATLVGSGATLAVDRLDPLGLDALRRHHIRIEDGQRVANEARVIKTEAELVTIGLAVEACERSVAEMARALVPGRTEIEVWSELHRANIAAGGEWLETRLLTSGHRTNPWYQEASSKPIAAGELVAFDTDLIGVGGYSVDISRTWVAGDGPPSSAQRELHTEAQEQLEHNIKLFTPGASFAEIANRAHLPPAHIHSVTNAAVAHGIGLCNEYPLILNRDLFADSGYDGEVREGMVLCVEALAAPPGGPEAVKLEEQIVITAQGPQRLSTYPIGLCPDR